MLTKKEYLHLPLLNNLQASKFKPNEGEKPWKDGKYYRTIMGKRMGFKEGEETNPFLKNDSKSDFKKSKPKPKSNSKDFTISVRFDKKGSAYAKHNSNFENKFNKMTKKKLNKITNQENLVKARAAIMLSNGDIYHDKNEVGGSATHMGMINRLIDRDNFIINSSGRDPEDHIGLSLTYASIFASKAVRLYVRYGDFSIEYSSELSNSQRKELKKFIADGGYDPEEVIIEHTGSKSDDNSKTIHRYLTR